MDELRFNKREIVDYLLGSLPEAEAEKFDELSFTDDGFADALNSCEKDLVDAYARGELAGAALEKFESYYLASPVRREKVAFAETFQIYANKNISQGSENFASEKLKADQTSTGFLSLPNVFKNKFSALQWSFGAALLLLAVFGGFAVFSYLNSRSGEIAKQIAPVNVERETPQSFERKDAENSNQENEIAANSANNLPQPESEKEQTKKPSTAQVQKTPQTEKSLPLPKSSIAALILAPSLRGGNQITTLAISRQTTAVDVQLELEPAADFPAYRVALADEAGNANLWRSGALKAVGADENKRLKIRFPAKLLKSKIYSLTVSGINSGGEAEIINNYSFRVVLK